ncbi:MAG: hypothetical protein IJV89_04105, partial [Lentisphaeria bacterium]|nr:hypothetical protein [Lentisphaeria bacterium]
MQLALSPKRSIQPEISVKPVCISGNAADFCSVGYDDRLPDRSGESNSGGIPLLRIVCAGHLAEGVLILRNSSLKLKTVADNAILLNYAVSSENIFERIKTKTENSFYLKVNVGIFRRNKRRPGKQSHYRHLFIRFVRKRKIKQWHPRDECVGIIIQQTDLQTVFCIIKNADLQHIS